MNTRIHFRYNSHGEMIVRGMVIEGLPCRWNGAPMFFLVFYSDFSYRPMVITHECVRRKFSIEQIPSKCL